MPRYTVEFSSAAYRQFSKLDRAAQVRLASAIEALRDDPRPPGASKLMGTDGLYRIRVGTYRVVYAIEDGRLVVLVVSVGPRRDVYRGL